MCLAFSGKMCLVFSGSIALPLKNFRAVATSKMLPEFPAFFISSRYFAIISA